MRVDDQGNEIMVKVAEEKEHPQPTQEPDPIVLTRKDKVDMLDRMIESWEKLPPQALAGPVSGSDLCSLMLLLSSILKSD